MFTDQEKLDNAVRNSYMREVEIHHYQVNIDNYAHMLENLPSGDWPSDIEPYKYTEIYSLPHDLTDEQVDTIITLQNRDRIRSIIRTEKSEQHKCILFRNALKDQIGPDYDALVIAYKATQNDTETPIDTVQ